MLIGEIRNEAATYADTLTGRPVWRLTSAGVINMTPTYHTNSGFMADGCYLVLVSIREGVTWLLRAEKATGERLVLWRAPGLGDRSYLHRGMEFPWAEADGRGLCGNRVCLAPRSAQAVLAHECALLRVDLHSGEVNILLEDCGEEWIFGAPAVDLQEKWVAIALSSAHPQLLAGQPVTRNYCSYPDHRLRLIRVRLDGSGQQEVLFEQSEAGSAHCAFCPTDASWLYFDLDRPPHYWGGGDGATPRVWALDLRTGQARPVVSAPDLFPVHTAWLWDECALAYHGRLPSGGVYFGITRPEGDTLWRREFPEARAYGHLTPDRTRPALVVDGDFSPELLQWLYYDSPQGGIEPICRHGTEWESLGQGTQYSHPHPLADPTGRWLAFNAAHQGRQDVYVVEVGKFAAGGAIV